MIIGMVAMALLVVLAKFTGYFQYKYMKVQSAKIQWQRNLRQKASNFQAIRFARNFSFESYPSFRDSNMDGPWTDREVENRGYNGFENLVEEGMKIITDTDDDVFIHENKSLIK